MLLEAIGKLEAAVLKPQQKAAPCGVFAELVEMSEAIARTRREIAQIKPPFQFDKQLISATKELDHIVEATEKATSDILAAAEDIQEVAWTLREREPTSSCATRSISAPPTSTPLAHSRTSRGSAPTRWCVLSASSSSASTQ